jgi:ABC-type hemin transport system ATPase subunit
MTAPILELKHLTRHFGGIRAVDDVSLQLFPGEIVGLIGPNGAGKTTLVNLISGFLQASSGQVIFNGEDITRVKPQRIARKGIARGRSVLFGLRRKCCEALGRRTQPASGAEGSRPNPAVDNDDGHPASRAGGDPSGP